MNILIIALLTVVAVALVVMLLIIAFGKNPNRIITAFFGTILASCAIGGILLLTSKFWM